MKTISLLTTLFFCLLFFAYQNLRAQKTSSPSSYRDLNKNGKKDVYEDAQQPVDKRVEDLLRQMTLEEKAGQMFIEGTGINEDGSIGKKEGTQVTGFAAMLPTPDVLIKEMNITHLNFWTTPPTKQLVMGINAIQKVAEQSRLGIPVTVYSDPRHYFSNNIFSMESKGISKWPEQLGFAAIGDPKLVKQFANIARQEYLALGIRGALHPMADLSTEPRWARCSGTFGEDAQLSAKLITPYIEGFQNGLSLNRNSVICMTKHFSGGGPQREGLDPHFEFQKGQVYPGNNFNYHLIPFEAAIKANTGAIMPYYGVPTGQTSENVAMAYNKDIITGLLRGKYHYEGVVCTDWGLITDVKMGNIVWHARAWGAESLSMEDRVLKIINAGCDQFGGESCPAFIVNLVQQGKLSEERINQSLRRILKAKFLLGLFDNPYVDANKTSTIIGNPQWKALGEKTQSRSITVLKNNQNILPLQRSKKYKFYVENMNKNVVAKYGTVVDTPEAADFAILRKETPWVPVVTDNPFAKGFHHGDLDFKEAALSEILNICNRVPTIIDIYLDRPAILTDINQAAKAIVANYGASDEALLNALFGVVPPEGKLPFELPSSMEAVRQQKEDLPYDSKNPLYPFGFGLRYKDKTAVQTK